MWSKSASRIADETVNVLLERAAPIIRASNGKESVRWGKDFFVSHSGEDNNLDLLRRIHLDVWLEIAGVVNFVEPVVDHGTLLIKGAGAAGTNLHQDRPYWESRDATPSIFSVWIALEDMTYEKDGIMLSVANEVSVDEMASFNTGSVFEHEYRTDAKGEFPITILPAAATRIAESMVVVDLARGEAVAFDSFEPHMSGPNVTSAPRLAMKIAYSERAAKTHFIARTEVLDAS